LTVSALMLAAWMRSASLSHRLRAKCSMLGLRGELGQIVERLVAVIGDERVG
jgi:hypothetical protein